MTIGEKIRNLRRDKNMSQNELADILGVTNQAMPWIVEYSFDELGNCVDIKRHSV